MSNLTQEEKTVEAMIRIYCKNHHAGDPLCTSCAALTSYVNSRLEKCVFGENKPTCKNYKVHCYQLEMRERIKEVMRYAGPRMLFRHTFFAIRHLFKGIKS